MFANEASDPSAFKFKLRKTRAKIFGRLYTYDNGFNLVTNDESFSELNNQTPSSETEDLEIEVDDKDPASEGIKLVNNSRYQEQYLANLGLTIIPVSGDRIKTEIIDKIIVKSPAVMISAKASNQASGEGEDYFVNFEKINQNRNFLRWQWK